MSINSILLITLYLLPVISKAQENKKISPNIFLCPIQGNCLNAATKYLDRLDKSAGIEIESKRYKTEASANIAAARKFHLASVEAKREVHWITFEDETLKEDAYGFTYPAVSKYRKNISNNAARVYDNFYKKNKIYKARSLGHSHYDLNECFSRHDLSNMYRKMGNFILLTKSGNISYINQAVLETEYGITPRRGVRSYLHRQTVNNKIKRGYAYIFDTGVYGKYIGNVDENITKKLIWTNCNNVGR